jgi:hypothetical protein
MLSLCYGWSKKDFYLSREKRYLSDQLYERLKPFVSDRQLGPNVTAPALLQVPLWVKVDGQHVLIETPGELSLACKLVTIFHNTDCNAPLCDDWEEETLDMERRAAAILGSESSDEDEKKAKG